MVENLMRVRSEPNTLTLKSSNCEDSEDQVVNSAFSVAAGLARVQFNLLVDPVLHG